MNEKLKVSVLISFLVKCGLRRTKNNIFVSIKPFTVKTCLDMPRLFSNDETGNSQS
jgi:hypothetical protein